MTELLKLKARVEELEGALKPFAKVADGEDESHEAGFAPKPEPNEYVSVYHYGLKLRDFINARSALNRKGSEE